MSCAFDVFESAGSRSRTQLVASEIAGSYRTRLRRDIDELLLVPGRYPSTRALCNGECRTS